MYAIIDGDTDLTQAASATKLNEVKAWLKSLEYATDPTPVIDFRRWALQAHSVAKRNKMSGSYLRNILEMTRRSERTIGLIIRNGQRAGMIRKQGDRGIHVNQYGSRPSPSAHKLSADSFLPRRDLDANAAGVYAFVDGVTELQFEETLRKARNQNNFSRANIARLITSQSREEVATRFENLSPIEQLRDLAERNHTTRQIADALGYSITYTTRLAQKEGIDIAADRVVGHPRHIDPVRVIDQTVAVLSGLESGLALVDRDFFDTVPPEQAEQWLAALSGPLSALYTLRRELNRV